MARRWVSAMRRFTVPRDDSVDVVVEIGDNVAVDAWRREFVMEPILRVDSCFG